MCGARQKDRALPANNVPLLAIRQPWTAPRNCQPRCRPGRLNSIRTKSSRARRRAGGPIAPWGCYPGTTERLLVDIADENAVIALLPLFSKAQVMRHRLKRMKSPKVRPLEEAHSLREQARMLPFGPVRDAALTKARQAEPAAHMEDWLNSPGLQPRWNDDTHGRN